MTNLEQLTNEFCPNGVASVRLEMVCFISKGVQFNKTDMADEGTYPVINGGINPSGYIERYNQNENTITISQGGASAGYVNWLQTKFWAGAHCYILKPTSKILNRYLFHFVKSKECKLQECQYGAGIPALAKSTIASLQIPLPPLPVQREIVRILDHYTECTTELMAKLTEELTARKRQYEYYTEYLLKSSDDVEYMLLEELASFTYGYTDKAGDAGTARFIRITDINDQGCLNDNDKKYITLSSDSERYILQQGDLIVARTGATYGKTLYFEGDELSVYASFLIRVKLDNTKILNRYYWHFTKSPLYWEQANNLVSKGGQPQFNTNAIKRILVPVPSIERQKYVVAILDRFDKLCNDISEGLPAEIEARKKQYEYYRDKLLAFERAE